jgi:serine/threonine protein kinase/WD40 repeat protein
MPDVAEHPSLEQLRAYTQGRLDPADHAAVENHVLACESCCRTLEVVPADSFEERLRGAEEAAFATTTDGSSPTLSDPPGVPAELTDHPKYRVLALVGQGGMGAVYRAEHRKMDRTVALKVINPALLRNPSTVSRFHQEVKAAAKLSHPNIVTAHDADQAGELHFLVMEFVEGTSLAEIAAQRGPLSVAEACGYAKQAALGLQHAHERGMVHRDIKPHNLMLTPDGVVKILDFGLARFAHAAEEAGAGEAPAASSLTTAGAVMGTADYIAPEQVADARAADTRADVYALGCTLFHLLAGRPPFPVGTNADKFKHHAETPLPVPEEWPAELKAVLRKLTAKKPAERYSTPTEVAAALEPLARVAPVKPKPHRRWLMAAALLFLIGAVAAVVVIRVQTENGREVVVTTDDPNLEIVTKKGGQIVRIRDPKTGQTWELDTKNLTMRDLEHPDGFTIKLDGRGDLTFKSAGGKVTVSTGPPAVAKEPTFQPLFNGKDLGGWIAFGGEVDLKKAWTVNNEILRRAGQASSHLRTAKKYRDYTLQLEFRHMMVENPFATGLTLALHLDNAKSDKIDTPVFLLTILQSGVGKIEATAGATESGASPIGFRAKLQPIETSGWDRLTVTSRDGTLEVAINGIQMGKLTDCKPREGYIALVGGLDPVEFRDIEIKELRPAEATRPTRSTDPIELAKLPNAADALKQADIPEIARAYIGRGDPTEIPPELVAVLGDVRFRVSESRGPMAFSPDGTRLAVADDRKDEVRVFDARTGQLLRHFAMPYTPRYKMAFSPDGKRLAGTTVGDAFSVFEVDTGRLIWKRDPVQGRGIENFTFSADGKTVYVGPTGDFARTDPPARLEQLDADTGGRKRSWPIQDRQVAFAVSPDGTKLVEVPTAGWHVRLRDLSTPDGEKVKDLGMNGTLAAFSPDGKHFVTACTGYHGKRRVAIHDAKGDVLHVLPEGGARLTSAVFTPDGKTLATESLDGAVRWEVATGKKLGSWPSLGSALAGYVLSPDGATLALRRQDKHLVALYDTATGKLRHVSTSPASAITALAFSPDGKYLASSDRRDTKLWDLAGAREFVTWKTLPANCIAFSPDAKLSVLAGETHFRVLRVADGEQLFVSETKSKKIESVCFSPDGALIATTGGGGDVRLWRTTDGKEVRVFGYPKSAHAVTFSPDGSKVIAVGGHGVRVWETNTGTELRTFLDETACQSPEWLADGKTLAIIAAGTTGGGVWHVDPESGKVVKKLQAPDWWNPYGVLGPGARLMCLLEPEGFAVAQLDPDPIRRRTFRLSPSPGAEKVGSRAAAFSADGRYLACGNADGVISLLRLSEKGKVPQLQILPPTVRELADRPNAADALKPADVTDLDRAFVAGGNAKQTPPELVGVLGETRFRGAHDDRYDGPRALRNSPDGKLLAALTPHGGIDLYDVATGRVTLSFRGERRFNDIAFAPDGSRGRDPRRDRGVGRAHRQATPRLQKPGRFGHVVRVRRVQPRRQAGGVRHPRPVRQHHRPHNRRECGAGRRAEAHGRRRNRGRCDHPAGIHT